MENNNEQNNIDVLENDTNVESNEEKIEVIETPETQSTPVVEQNVAVDSTPVVETLSTTPSEENNIEIVGDNQTIDNGQTINVDSNLNVNKKSGGKKIAIICAVVAVVLVVGFFLFQNFVLLNKKTIITTTVNKFFTMVSDGIDNVKKNTLSLDFASDSVGINGKLSFSSNYKDDSIDLTKLDKYTINYDSVLDIKNGKVSLDASLDKENKSLIKLQAYIADKLALFKSESLSYSTFKYDLPGTLKDMNLNNTINYDDINKLVKKANDIIVKDIDEEKITKESVKADVNGKEESLVKVTYTFNINELSEKVKKGFSEDSEALSILAKLTNSSESDVKEFLTDNSTIKKDDDSLLKVSVYSSTLFGEVKKIVLQNVEGSNNGPEFSFDKVGNTKSYKLYASKDDTTVTGLFDLGNSEYSVQLAMKDITEEFKLKKVNDNKYSGSISVVENKMEVAVDFVIENKINGDSQNTLLNLGIKVRQNDDTITFNVESETNVTKGATVKEISSLGARSIEDLSYYEISYMENKLYEILLEVMSDLGYLTSPVFGEADIYGNYGSSYGSGYSTTSSYSTYDYSL